MIVFLLKSLNSKLSILLIGVNPNKNPSQESINTSNFFMNNIYKIINFTDKGK